MLSIFKRKYRTLALLAVVAVLFYLLQCFTVSRLGQLTSRKTDRKWSDLDLAKDLAGFEDDDGQLLFKQRNRIVDADSKFGSELDHDKDFDRDDKIFHKPEFESDDTRPKYQDIGNNKDNNIVHMSANEIEVKLLPNQPYRDQLQVGSVCRGEADNVETAESDKASRDAALAHAHSSLLGVHPSQAHLYKADEQNMFVCLTAQKVRIPFELVNDDFCDCPDSSDEPGTSACPDSKFYCSRQLSGSPPQYIMSSKVNDGICDCCDGSDEWLGARVPDHIRIREGEPLGAVYHAPCSDKCQAIVALQEAEETIRAKGRELQKEYLKKAGFELTETERKNYGPNGIFYPLSKQCFKLKDKQYEYEVCPFEKVTQQDFPHSPVTLGRVPKVILEKGQQVLVMDGGDNSLCPFGRGRKSKLYFLCGLEDKLMRVTESELCEYSFTLSSPAAC